MPEGGILNAGWKVEFNNKPLRMPGLPARLGNPGDVYTIGLELGPDGTVMDSVAGGPAFNAGISPGMKVAGVDGRLYTHDVLEDAIKAAADSSAPITLLVVDDDYYRTTAIDYHGGERYPHLVREDGKPDYLDELIKAHAQ
jgi:predicted metalloprotease with PDZ domain